MRPAIIIAMAVILSGCNPEQSRLNINANPVDKTPIRVLAVGDEGVILQYGDGAVVHYPAYYYISKTIISSGFERGEWLTIED